MEASFGLSSLRWWAPLAFGDRFDIVITVCPPLQSAIIPTLYSRLRKVPWVFHIQDLQVDAAIRLNLLNSGLLTRILYGAENYFLARATKVSSISTAMIDRLKAKGAKRPLLFPNWADLERVRPVQPDPNLRRKLGASNNDVLVLYAGAMGEKQGLELVVNAASHLRDAPNIKFALVGAGPSRSRLETSAKELGLTNIQFLDVFPVEQLSNLLAAGDIHLVVQKAAAADLVLPSKLTNILAAGKPSLVTAEEGTILHDVITASNAGIVVPPQNLSALLSGIKSLAANTEARQLLGQNARDYAEAHLDKDGILTKFEAHLVSLVGEKA